MRLFSAYNGRKKEGEELDSFITWIGGKRLLRKQIIEMFPREGIEKYVEVFGGAAWVLFGKDPHPKEVYNDIDGELVNLFRMVKEHPEALEKEISLKLNSREEFFFQLERAPKDLTELQRAARLYYLIRASFGADVRSFGCSARTDVSMIKNLQGVHERLKNVLIEHKSYEDLIKAQDGPKTLFYLDPPYHGTENKYKVSSGWRDEEHERLKNVIEGIAGYWVLSYNDDEFIRELYKEYEIIPLERCNNNGHKDGKKGTFKELVIRNY